jgi:hypothetical protein
MMCDDMLARIRTGTASALAVLLAACSSSSESPSQNLAGPGPNPTTTSTVPTGCPDGAPVCIATPSDGFVVQSVGTSILPGEDVQYCEVVALPGTAGQPIYVSGIDGKMTPYSHHLNIMAVEPGSPADAATTPGQRVKCAGNGRVPFGTGLHQIFGAVSPENSLILPDGVGHRLDGGQKVIFNYHYFNPSTAPVPAKAALAFHLTEASNVRRELRRFGMYNTGFVVPAHTQGTFIAECMMAEDVQLLSLLRHTHRWGTDFTVWRAGGASDGQEVFVSRDWEEGITYAPSTPFIIKQGEGLRFECKFDNTTDRELRFGELVSDEMCILYGNIVSTRDNVPSLPEDCAIPSSPQGQVVRGFPCAQCPDGD